MLRCYGVHVQVPGLQLGPAARFANDSQLFFPVAALLESSVPEESKGALQVRILSSDITHAYGEHSSRAKTLQRRLAVKALF